MNKRVVALLIALALSVTGCFALPANPVPPYLVLLTPILPGTNGTCTGAVIGPRTVLTAAHCVESAKRAVTAYGQEVWVKDAYVSPDHDVAVLFTADVLWVHNYAELGTPALGMQASLWGYCPYMANHVKRHAFYNGLRTVEMNAKPARDFGEWHVIGGKVCGGDSGAPIIQNGKVVGVLSMVSSDLFWVALGSTAYTVPPDYGQAIMEEIDRAASTTEATH